MIFFKRLLSFDPTRRRTLYADEPYFIVDECDVFSNENPDENDSASVSKSEIQDEEEENKTFYDEDSGYDSY